VDNDVTIEIAIPKELLSEVEEQSQSRGETVSQFFCRGAQTLLRRHKERRMLEEFVESRTKMPDSSEVEEARRTLQGGGDH
jgi:metal-responsive CopG/Arc/MetJ family transcriptional regulator